MPSRRKCAHTTKIERVPRYEAYHGEEDLDDRLSSDGTLDLSMKRIKVEPPDCEKTNDVGRRSGGGGGDEMDTAVGGIGEGNVDLTRENSVVNEYAESSASPSGETQKYLLSVDDSQADDTNKTADRASSAVVVSNADQQVFIDSNGHAVSAATGLKLFPQTTKGKSVRPFKLYTSNRDLLSGIATQGAPSLATYSVPVALAAVPGAVPLAFASLPLVTGAPMIPVTASTTSSSSRGAGSATSCTTSTSSSSSTNATSKSTSSTTDAHLMTLATEADKILRERHESGESSDSAEGNAGAEAENYSGDSKDSSMFTGEEGTVLKIPTLSGQRSGSDSEGDALSFIQKRAVAAAVAATNPPKNKKKRQILPDQMKDPAYWERRRKNNEAAKRSRDARRAKEDQIAIRAALLEQENIRLKIEVVALKEETAKLRSRLYSNNNS